MTTTALPATYLGLGARLTSGPSELVVRSGFRVETDCGPLLHHWFGLVDLTHVLALLGDDLIDREPAAALIRALLDMDALDPADFPWDPAHGDPYNSREHHLAARLGAVAGRLHLGRTRREAGRTVRLLARDPRCTPEAARSRCRSDLDADPPLRGTGRDVVGGHDLFSPHRCPASGTTC